MLEQAKVAFVPGEAFGAPGYGRFSFALGDDDLVEGITRLAEPSCDPLRPTAVRRRHQMPGGGGRRGR